MNAYFLEIAVVRLSANLLGKKLIDNYAFHGSLSRFSSVKLQGVSETKGIENVPGKAECFNFGALCGRVIGKNLGKLSEKEALFLDAEVARQLFVDMSPEKRAPYTDAEIQSAMRTIITAMVKKAQIRTHTAKPGEEDINKWLAAYYSLERDFDGFVNSLVEEILSPNPELTKKYSSFFDKTDTIVSLALGKNISPNSLKAACEAAPKSTIGRILLEVVQSA